METCSWISTINIMKVATLSKFICRFNAVPVKIQRYFIDLGKKIKNSMESQKSQIAKVIPKSKNISGGITIVDFKLYYRAIMMKTAWC